MGPIGPAGPQGPAGGVSGHQIVSQVYPLVPTNIGAFATITGSASCPAGKVAIGGGYDGLNTEAWFMFNYASYPSSANTWTVSLKNRDSGPKMAVQIRVFVVCAVAQ
jgi:hypothetical protein